ncbi:HIT family hydrolase, diadenosine tetraphosphate hydrolase [Deinococcus aerius]|uniref:HIT family hydrolase, diadenosine tetraphosphate hydrolase n=1 Tax=Deinococcus aerius TaxID=200253 RepID=A0A2I9CRX0_9DEIO|nr:HIT family protein [Deinococcus aerius]GBF04333.1 HIT family hydrolase, diadenosine tetraphosphate hydrolase [Deinococcus aerius]
MRERRAFDLESYVRRTRTGPCFVCEFLRGNPDYAHHALYQDDFAAVFLARTPNREGRQLVQAPGYTLVVPREHREQVAHDFTLAEYLRLQEVVYHVAGALRQELPTERVYVLSLGSQQGNSHVHWHVVALPPGVPYDEQQFHFLMAEYGVVELTEGETADIAARLRARLQTALGGAGSPA